MVRADAGIAGAYRRVAMNIRRVASLLRELADAIEQPDAERPRRRTVVRPGTEPSQGKVDEVRRKLRKAGVAA